MEGSFRQPPAQALGRRSLSGLGSWAQLSRAQPLTFTSRPAGQEAAVKTRIKPSHRKEQP
jgi:hypothetical protein